MAQHLVLKPSSRTRLLLGAAAVALAGCEGSDNPEAGQTGSPVVSPDYESPVPFRPPAQTPPGGGPSPELPSRPLTPPDRTASFGAWLYVATERGLFAFDTSAPSTGSPTAQLLPAVVPRWVGVDGATLNVIASALPDDPAAVEQSAVTRLYRFDLARDPGAPELLGGVDLPGSFYQARLGAGRLVTLSAEFPALQCAPDLGFVSNAFAPERMVVSDFRAESGAWVLAQELGVEAEGFIETDDAFVLTQGGYFGTPALLTVVEIGAAALSTWPSLSVEGEVMPRAAMAVARQRLALFQNTPNGVELRVHTANGAAAAVLPVALPPENREWQGVNAVRFHGAFALAPWADEGTSAPGVIIDWQREAGPSVTAELPADLPHLRAIGDRWLAWGAERSVVFRVGEQGTFEVESELGRPFEGREGYDVYWDAAAQRAVVPYMLTGSGIGSAPSEHALAVLDLSAATPAWSAGLRSAGRPSIGAYDSVGFVREDLHFRRTDAGLFALTSADDIFVSHWLLEAIDPSRAQTQVVAFAERTLAASLSGVGSAELRASYRGTRSVRLSGPGDAPSATDIALGYGANRLARSRDGWLSYSLEHSNACWAEETRLDGGVCLPSGSAALSRLALDPPRLVADTPLDLPRAEVEPTGRITHEWLEVVAQGDRVALLEHRGVSCRTESECDALGIGFEVDTTGGGSRQCDEDDAECLAQPPVVVRRVSGNQNQRWLHPYDLTTGAVQTPIRLPDTDGYGWLGADGLSVEEGAGAALSLVTPIEMAADGSALKRARIELLRLPTWDAAGLANEERITVPGFPIYLTDTSAVTIEPAGAVDAAGGAVAVRVHRLSLARGLAYLEQTLELPSGHAGHLWAKERGYVLLIADDRCAEPNATLVSVRLNGGVLEEAGRLDLPGTSWQLAQASDALVLLTRSRGSLAQHALVDAAADRLTLRALETRAGGVAVSVFEDRVLFAP